MIINEVKNLTNEIEFLKGRTHLFDTNILIGIMTLPEADCSDIDSFIRLHKVLIATKLSEISGTRPAITASTYCEFNAPGAVKERFPGLHKVFDIVGKRLTYKREGHVFYSDMVDLYRREVEQVRLYMNVIENDVGYDICGLQYGSVEQEICKRYGLNKNNMKNESKLDDVINNHADRLFSDVIGKAFFAYFVLSVIGYPRSDSGKKDANKFPLDKLNDNKTISNFDNVATDFIQITYALDGNMTIFTNDKRLSVVGNKILVMHRCPSSKFIILDDFIKELCTDKSIEDASQKSEEFIRFFEDSRSTINVLRNILLDQDF